MAKKLLLLEGSPRTGGNSATLGAAFAAALDGWTVDTVTVCRRQIRGCVACEACWSRGGLPCVQKDDMNELCVKIEEADAVAFVTPLYYFGFPMQLKAVLDRLYPYCKDNRPRSIDGKRAVLLCCGATDDLAEFDAITANYHMLLHYLGWQDAGSLIAPGLYQRGAVDGTDWIRKAAMLAAGLNNGC